MRLNVLPICILVHQVYVCVVPAEVRRGSLMLWGSNYVWLKAIIWVLGVELGPTEEQSVLVTTESSLSSQIIAFQNLLEQKFAFQKLRAKENHD